MKKKSGFDLITIEVLSHRKKTQHTITLKLTQIFNIQ